MNGLYCIIDCPSFKICMLNMVNYFSENSLKAMALDSMLTSTLIKEIGLQLEIVRLSLSFFSIKVIIACFWELDNSPLSNEQ